MRRLIAIAVLASAALTGNGAQALSATQSFSIGFSSQGPVGASGFINTTVDRLTGAVTQTFGFVCSFSPAVSCQNGAFQIVGDPIAQTAQITGTVGPMTVSLDFLATHVNSTVPYIDIEVLPSPGANFLMNYGRMGRVNGTVTSTNGVVPVANAFGSVGFTILASAP